MGKVFSGAAKAVTQGVKAVVQPVYNATLKQIPGVDNALVGLDKAVGKSIPGGWGTVAAVASSFIPGAQLAAMGMTKAGLATGLGALSGSGVMKKGHNFNLQGAIVGGAMAYGASQLAAGLQDAGNATTKSIEEAAKSGAVSGGESALANTGSAAAEGASKFTPTANALQNIPSDFVQPLNESVGKAFSNAGEYGIKNLASSAGEYGLTGASNVPSGLGASAAPSFLESVGSGAAKTASGTLSNMGSAGQGLANLAGLGAESGTAAAARAAFSNAVTNTGMMAGVAGLSGMAALEEQQKYLDQQLSSGNIAQAEYDAAKAKIDDQIATANKAVSDNPFSTTPDRSYEKQDTLYTGTGPSDSLYNSSDVSASKTLYARGGSVDDEYGMDEARGLGLGNLSNGFMNMGSTPAFAAGGQPRFLSGGGDGMSDSIRASIEGKQEARLADGEFVIPADVVSHLGNGSSKAGAKQLYSMMDKVRQARVGTKKQGKQINPRKFLAA